MPDIAIVGPVLCAVNRAQANELGVRAAFCDGPSYSVTSYIERVDLHRGASPASDGITHPTVVDAIGRYGYTVLTRPASPYRITMHVQYVALCDQVILGADGKPSLIGVFNDIQAPSLPITIPRMAFAARILFTADEAAKTHRVEVRITGPTGNELGRPGGEVSLPPPPAGMESLAVDLPIQFDLFEVAGFGRYTFLLHVNDAPSAAVQLTVRQATAA